DSRDTKYSGKRNQSYPRAWSKGDCSVQKIPSLQILHFLYGSLSNHSHSKDLYRYSSFTRSNRHHKLPPYPWWGYQAQGSAKRSFRRLSGKIKGRISTKTLNDSSIQKLGETLRQADASLPIRSPVFDRPASLQHPSRHTPHCDSVRVQAKAI